ncbi:hypothetical protein B0I35DRAFT_480352 [Stachybotrys elegans]|uniref:Uncharacterized protein n=1 Tax=Stachybotrys elegans TaxID=80388 RepID=A0A8K0WPD3_9HYPO|nr:hypothetical protein B0I35DRAFT_480352 [Stachybotrys elegans]
MASANAKVKGAMTMTQHDGRAPAPPHLVYRYSEDVRDDRRPRHVPSVSYRDGVAARRPSIASGSSRAVARSRGTASGASESREAEEQRSRYRLSTKATEQPRSRREADVRKEPEFRGVGAWSDQGFVNHRGYPKELLQDAPDPGLYGQPSIGEGRLPTPDLVPVQREIRFCACCVDAEAVTNEAWYQARKAKMDSQLEAAMEHISRMNAGTVRRLKY